MLLRTEDECQIHHLSVCCHQIRREYLSDDICVGFPASTTGERCLYHFCWGSFTHGNDQWRPISVEPLASNYGWSNIRNSLSLLSLSEMILVQIVVLFLLLQTVGSIVARQELTCLEIHLPQSDSERSTPPFRRILEYNNQKKRETSGQHRPAEPHMPTAAKN